MQFTVYAYVFFCITGTLKSVSNSISDFIV